MTLALDQFLIDSGASPVAIQFCDFSGMGDSSVIASGAAGSHINLTYNYWGTGIASEIDSQDFRARVTPTSPTIDYQPFLNQPSQPHNLRWQSSVRSDQTVTLSAGVKTTVGDPVDGGYCHVHRSERRAGDRPGHHPRTGIERRRHGRLYIARQYTDRFVHDPGELRGRLAFPAVDGHQPDINGQPGSRVNW